MHADILFPNITSTLQITGCHFAVKPAGWTYPKHHHHLYELMYGLSGEGKLSVGGEDVRLRAGSWLLLKAGVRHDVSNASEGEDVFSFFNIHFDIDDSEMRRRLSASDYALFPDGPSDSSARLRSHVGEIERIMEHSLLHSSNETAGTEKRLTLTYERKLALQAYILLIVQDIFARHAEGAQASGSRQRETTIYEADTAHLIEERLMRLVGADGSVTRIAEELNISRSQCTKIFTKIYGIPPRQYVTEQRLNKAKQLLVGTNKTVSDIAEELGFHSVSHFSRQFRRGTGMSPNQFRPRHMR